MLATTSITQCLCPERHQAGLRGECEPCRVYRVQKRLKRRQGGRAAGLAPEPDGKPLRYMALASEHDALAADVAAAMPYVQIARKYHTTEWTLMAYLQAVGLYVSTAALKSQAIDAVTPRVKRLRAKGLTFDAIATRVGLSTHSIRRICHGIRKIERRKSHAIR